LPANFNELSAGAKQDYLLAASMYLQSQLLSIASRLAPEDAKSVAADAVDGCDVGTGGDPIDMHSAGAAERHAAAKLRPGHAEYVAQHPKKRGITVGVNGALDTIDLNRGGHITQDYSRESAIMIFGVSSSASFRRIAP
jgi:hypothetical protein